ncbi:MAG: hypothetical protein M3461_04940 [Pseudomonadota bacterium]|nr:hypothetical protein [Pseudomonadota bacterium]
MERLDKLLNANAGRIVLLSGGWGVGKTFQWVAALNRHRATAPNESARYAYVSMFGLGSVPEVRRRIAEEMVASIRLPGTGTIGDQVEPDGWKLKPMQLMKLLPVVPYLSKLEGLASELSFGAVRDAVICFDDLERASPQLRLADLLGLALFMKEQRNCRIVLLTNPEKLKESDKPDLERYLERVVDEVLRLQPTPQEAAEIAFKDKASKVASLLAPRLIELGVNNIRVIARLHDLALELESALAEYRDGVLNQAVQAVALFGVAHFLPTDDFPSVAYLETYGSDDWFRYTRDVKEPAEMSNDERRYATWNELLQNYGYGSTDELDLEVSRTIQRGFVDAIALQTPASKLSAQLDGAASRQILTNAWEVLSGSFDNNKDEVVNALATAAVDCVQTMGVQDMHSIYSVLLDLGEDERASRALESFIAANQQHPEVFDLSNNPFSGYITLAEFRHRMQAEHEKHNVPKSLEFSLDSIDIKRGWSAEDLQRVAAATEQEMYDVLRPAKGSVLRSRLRTLTDYGAPLKIVFVTANCGLQRVMAKG